jgi:hypothetical protein
MKTSDIEINTRPYLASHGQEPRGFGNWWFEILNWQYYYQDHYGKAINAARKEMKRQCEKFGISSPPAITLLP